MVLISCWALSGQFASPATIVVRLRARQDDRADRGNFAVTRERRLAYCVVQAGGCTAMPCERSAEIGIRAAFLDARQVPATARFRAIIISA